MSENRPLLSMEHIRKEFPGVVVLDDVSFSVEKGEIHGLMGENGAGKSTLIKILTGIYPSDGGQIFVDGKEVDIRSKHDAMSCGISVIYQELSLIPTLTVMENIFLGQELTRGRVFLDKGRMRKRAVELIEKCHFSISPDDLVETLSVAKQQTVEILKALLMNAKLIIMDEPTASLNIQESESLFEIIGNLKKQGTSIIYISHRLEEIWRLADRLTILRDGVVRGVLAKEEIDPAKVVHMMIGKELKETVSQVHEPKKDGSVLKVENLSTRELLDQISFEAYGGQILGIGGLIGAGRTETLECIFGLRDYSEGTITLDGAPVPKSQQQAVRQGIGFVPEDRRQEGLVQLLSVEDNLALPNYDLFSDHGVVSRRKKADAVNRSIKQLRIKTASEKNRCMNLSGGNQQKVVLAKWLLRDLRVLLVDEPTVGIDVGSKSEIYEILRKMADEGGIVIVVSSDAEELLNISDRILMLVDGKVFDDMPNVDLTPDDLLLEASGIYRKERGQ
ncbi:MAG: sugar ABC transporter ATP-binding protein [Lachnospiraceae bacterium]|jgi:ribose transport system ATP-binding protein|nr:sugar ABC transporter ATP-binding protein [Lachnospiraceae bacterium]